MLIVSNTDYNVFSYCSLQYIWKELIFVFLHDLLKFHEMYEVHSRQYNFLKFFRC